MKKIVVSLVIIISLAVMFFIGMSFNKTKVVEKEVLITDSDYTSLVGVLENIPEIDRWTINRKKIEFDSIENDYDWEVTVYFENENDFTIVEPDVFKVKEKLNEIEIEEFLK